MTSPPPSVLTALSGRRKLQDGSPLGRGLDRNWQASDVGPSACPGPNTEEWATQDAATHPTTSMPQPLPASGMSFAYNIPCLLPSEEGPSVSEPPSLCHLGVEPMERSGPPHFETKNCSFILTLRPQERGPMGWGPRNDHHPRVASGPRISLGGLAAAAALYLPLVILSLIHVHSTPPEAFVPPLLWSVPLPSISTAQQPCPSSASQLGQREPIVPTRTGPCLDAHLRDGHLMPVSPPPVPMLSHPPPGGGVQLPLTG